MSVESELLVIYRYEVCVCACFNISNTMYAEESPDTINILSPKAENHNRLGHKRTYYNVCVC